jgi:hypothetical protein
MASQVAAKAVHQLVPTERILKVMAKEPVVARFVARLQKEYEVASFFCRFSFFATERRFFTIFRHHFVGK